MLTSRSLISIALIAVMTAPCAFAQTQPDTTNSAEQAPSTPEPVPSAFVWDRFKTTIKSNTRVTFTNGVMLAGSNNAASNTNSDAQKPKNKDKEKNKETEKEKEPNKRILAFNPKNKRAETVAENDVTYIAAAYPSLTKAKVAIVGQSCTQSECRAQDTKFVVIDGDFIKTYSIEDAKKVELKIQEGEDLWAKAEGISMGNDGYGAEIREALTFKTGLGFVNSTLAPRFQDMVGKHPEQFLNDPSIRDVLMNKWAMKAFCSSGKK